MMNGIQFIPNNNRSVIRMLSREYERYNRGRNRILMGAVCLCIITLTMVFGIAVGKVQAEYLKEARAAGTTASASIGGAGTSVYQKVRSLGYVKQAGRRVSVGWASAAKSAEGDGEITIQLLDGPAWERIISPAYTDIHGHYPAEEQEIMLPVRAMEELGIDGPIEGMKVGLTVSIGLFRKEQEELILSGWYLDDTVSAGDRGLGNI